MVECDECGEKIGMPYECSYCGRTLCKEHRLPENHECDGAKSGAPKTTAGDNDDGEADSTSIRDRISDVASRPSESKQSRERKQVQPDSLTLQPKSKSPLAILRRNLTYVFLGLMWATFLVQVISTPFLTEEMSRALFTLSTDNPEYVWTWVTSIFAHGSLFHIIGNSFVVFFFGRIVERRLGAKRYALFFIGTGAVAALSQVGVSLALGQTAHVLGASGAGLAILGFVTILNPSLPVYLIPLPIPVPLWLLTGFYAVFSLASVTAGGPAAGGIAQVAHLVGLVIGLVYGKHLEERVRSPNRIELSR